MKYIKMAGKIGCFFCKYIKQKNDRKNLILYRAKHSFCILNKFPYNTGHVMIATKLHKKSLEKLTDEELLDLVKLTTMAKVALDRCLKPQGYNIGINLGRIAGAGVPGHVHIHMVPRWSGDTNYMPVISNTKVMPLGLRTLYTKLRKQLLKLDSKD